MVGATAGAQAALYSNAFGDGGILGSLISGGDVATYIATVVVVILNTVLYYVVLFLNPQQGLDT